MWVRLSVEEQGFAQGGAKASGLAQQRGFKPWALWTGCVTLGNRLAFSEVCFSILRKSSRGHCDWILETRSSPGLDGPGACGEDTASPLRLFRDPGDHRPGFLGVSYRQALSHAYTSGPWESRPVRAKFMDEITYLHRQFQKT